MKTKTILNLMRSKCNKGNSWMVDNIQYLTLMGSHAYGTHHKDSDFDVYGFTIPPKEYIYSDHINGFDSPPKFDQFEGQIEGKTKNECLDFQIYNITKYFRLVMENNPNMIDSLFTRSNCELIVTDLARKVKDNRSKFLHKGMWHKFKGYSFSQINKIKSKVEDKENPVRKKLIEEHGYDTKFAVHVFRLLNEVEQLLNTGDMDLMKNREQLKQVLEGYYTLDEVRDYFKRNESRLEQSYENSKLPYGVNDVKDGVRELLIEGLEEYYG